MPTKDTLLQKVIPEADIAKYLSGKYTNPSGYIARADDISHAKKTEDVIEILRLDYPNTPFSSESGYGVIRFKTDPDTIEIPLGAKFGGKNTDGLPCTLNGFTACRNGHIIPEFKQPYNLPENAAELLHVDKNGVEKLVGKYFESEKVFLPYSKQGK